MPVPSTARTCPDGPRVCHFLPFPTRFRPQHSRGTTAWALSSPPRAAPRQERTKVVQQIYAKLRLNSPQGPDLSTPPHPQESILLPPQAGILHSHTRIPQSTFCSCCSSEESGSTCQPQPGSHTLGAALVLQAGRGLKMIWAQKLRALLLRLSWGWARSPAWDPGTWGTLCARNDLPVLLGGRWSLPSFPLDDPCSRRAGQWGCCSPGMCRGNGRAQAAGTGEAAPKPVGREGFVPQRCGGRHRLALQWQCLSSSKSAPAAAQGLQ